MTIPKLAVWPLLGLVGCIAGCSTAGVVPAGAGTTTAQVTGSVTYRERVALPANAVIRIRLVDVSRADAAAVLLGEQLIEANGKQVPFAFFIAYDTADIDARMTYAVQARIEADGHLLFISDRSHPVITRGAPTNVDLVLKAAGR